MLIEAVSSDEREEYFFRPEPLRPCVPFPAMEFYSNPPPKITRSVVVFAPSNNENLPEIMLCKRVKRVCKNQGIKTKGKAAKRLGENLVHEAKKGAEKVNDWVQEHKKEVIFGAILAAAVIGAVLVGPEALALLGLTPTSDQDKGKSDSDSSSNSPGSPPLGTVGDSHQLSFQSSSDFIASIAQVDPKVYYDLFPLPGQTKAFNPEEFKSPPIASQPSYHSHNSNNSFALVDPDGPVRVYDVQPPAINSSQVFVIAGKHRPDQLIVGGPGMNTSSVEARERGDYLSKLSNGSQVVVVHNACGPIPFDALYTVGQAINITSPATVADYQKILQQFHSNNQDNPHAKCFIIPHSRGTIALKKALENSPPEIRNRALVVAIAPAVVIPDELCFKSFNYASKNDPVPHLLHNYLHSSLNNVADEGIADLRPQLEVLEKEQAQLVLLDPHPEGSYFGHEFEDPIFEKVLERHITAYLEGNHDVTPYGEEK